MRCDGNHPGREARRGEYTREQCKLCWRELNQPALTGATFVEEAAPSKPRQTQRDPNKPKVSISELAKQKRH